jgi:phosphate-selective porin
MDLGDLPWLPIAVVIGVVAVVIIAALFFLGGGSGGESSPATPPVSSTSAPQTTVQVTQNAASITVRETTAPAVPPTGTWVMVEYIGSFEGSYGMSSDLQKTQNSGMRLYEVVNATGTIKAMFQKKDSSTKHDLTVTIYQDGKAVKFAKNSSAYGIVTVQYP